MFTDNKFESIKYIKKAYDLKPSVSFDIHLMLGKVYQENLKRDDLALIHYKKTIELDPNHPQREALKAVIRHLSEKQRESE